MAEGGGRGGEYPYYKTLARGRGRGYNYHQSSEGGYPYHNLEGDGGYPKPQIPVGGGYTDPHITTGERVRQCLYPQISGGRGYTNLQIRSGAGGRQVLYPQIPSAGGGGYPYPSQEGHMMVEQYKTLASRLIEWLNSTMSWILQTGVPTALMDIKALQTEITRVQTELSSTGEMMKIDIFRIHRTLENYGVSPSIIDESICPRNINYIWVQLESALRDRQVILQNEIDRLLKVIEKDAHHLEGRLDELDCVIRNFGKSAEGNLNSMLVGELKEIDNYCACVVNHLLLAGFSVEHPLHSRVLCIWRRAGQIRAAVDNSTSQTSPPGTSTNKYLMASQYQQSTNGAKMVETATSALELVRFCFKWIVDKQSFLDSAGYGSSMDSVKEAMDQHEKEHGIITSFQTEVDKCVIDTKLLGLEEQQPYEHCFSQVQVMYPVLCKNSLQHGKCLRSLHEFLCEATVELVWIDEKQAHICEFSRRLDEFSIPDEQMYKTLVEKIENRNSQIRSVEDHGYSMINDNHPARETVEVYISKIQSSWSWLQQLLKCLDKHFQDISLYHQFFQEVQSCEQWINQQRERVNRCILLLNIPFEDLEQMKIECQDLQTALVEYEERVAFLAKTSHDIIPLKQRNQQVTSPVKVYGLCVFEHHKVFEEYSLHDTSQKSQWVVTDSLGQQLTFPSICLEIPPPNHEAIDHANQLKQLLDQLKTLVKTYDRQLTKNMVMSTIKFIKSWDLGKFQSLGTKACEVLVRDLNEGAARFMAEEDQMMQQQLKKDLEECNSKVQQISKKLSEEVCEERQPDKTEHSAEDIGQSEVRGQSPQASSQGKPDVTQIDGGHLVNIHDNISDIPTKFGSEKRKTNFSGNTAKTMASSDESSDNDQSEIYRNTWDDDHNADSSVDNINGLTLQDGHIPEYSKADRKVDSATDGTMGPTTDEAVASTTNGAVASTTNGAVAPTTDEAVVPTTDPLGTRTSGQNSTLPSDAESPSLEMKAQGTSPGIVQNHSPAHNIHKAGPEVAPPQQISLDAREQKQQPEVSKALNMHEENNKPIHPLQKEQGDNSSNHLELSMKLSQKGGAGGDSKRRYPDNKQDKGLTDKKVSVKEFKVEEPSACDILASQDGNLFIRETEYTCKCIIKIEDKTKTPLQWDKPLYCDGWCQSQNNKRITLVLGKLYDLDARMVVIPSNGCFYPAKDFGDCFKGEKDAIIGTCLQHLKTSKLHLWETFFNSNTGSLPYSIICHAVLVDNEYEEHKKQGKKNLKQLYKRILDKAVEARLNSLAIPLCDYGGPSVDDQIYAVKGTIKYYLTASCCKDTQLDEIIVCVTEQEEANLVKKMMEDLSQSMEKHLFRLLFDVSEKFKGLTRQRKNPIEVKIEYGQLHEINADVLVNSTSLDMDLTIGFVSKALLDAAGQEIQKECRQHKSLLNLGEFVITGPGKLKTCKRIFHGSLPMWDPTPAKCEWVLKSFVKNCLLVASRKKMKSIAFPSLGTGQLKFPWHRTARTMYESVSEYERENKKNNLELIMFVINPKDERTNEAFVIEEKRQNAMKSENLSSQQCRNDKDYLEGVLRSNTKVVKITVCEGDMRDEPFDCTLIRMEKCDHEDRLCPIPGVRYYSAATTGSPKLHNEFKIHVRDEKDHLYRALCKVCEDAMRRRHTVLSFEDNKCFSKMSSGVVIEQFIDALNYQADVFEFLLEIHICISSLVDLANIESHVNAMNLKKSFFTKTFNLAWNSLAGVEDKHLDYVRLRKITKKTSHYPQPPFTVSIQGFSMESCKEAKTKIKKLINGSDAESLEEENGMDEDDDVITSTPFTASIQGFSMESCKEAEAKIKKLISGSDAESLEEENGMDENNAITSQQSSMDSTKTEPQTEDSKVLNVCGENNQMMHSLQKEQGECSGNVQGLSKKLSQEEKKQSDDSSELSHSILHGSDFYVDLVTDNSIGLSLQEGQKSESRKADKAVAPTTDGTVAPINDVASTAEKFCVLKLFITYEKSEGEQDKDDTFLHRVQQTFRIQAIWNFYNQTECGRKMLEAILEKHHCLVSLAKEKPFQGSFLFQIFNKTFHKRSDAKDYVQLILDTICQNADKELYIKTFTVDPRLYNDVLERVRQTKELDSVWIESGGEQSHEVYMVCLLEHKVVVTQRFSDIINATEECFKNHEELVGVDILWHRVMIKFGYLEEVKNKFPNIKISWDELKNGFVLKCPRDEARTAAGALLKILGTAQHEISEVSFKLCCQLEIFTHPEMCDYINSVIPQVDIVWLLNHLTKKIHLFAKDPKQLHGIDKAIKGCVLEKFYPVSKDHSISTHKTSRCLEELKKQHTGRLVIHSSTAGLLVTTADDIHEIVDAAIQEIISREGDEDQDGPVKQEEIDSEESSDDIQYGNDFYDPKEDLVAEKCENIIGLSLQDNQMPVPRESVRAPTTGVQWVPVNGKQ